MHRYPWISLTRALAVLRITVALLFLAHAVMRVANESVVQFAHFLGEAGLPFSHAAVWLITGFEIVGGALLLAARHVRLLSAGFIVLLLLGILLIHRHFGWFVGEHGTGGSEYSVALLAALLVIAAADEWSTVRT